MSYFKRAFTNSYSLAVIIFLFLLALILSVAEYASRTGFIISRLPSPIIGSGHDNFDLKVIRLEKFLEKNNRIDCIFIGSSTVDQGIDPVAFQLAYKQSTGQDLRCFNFGVAALTMPFAETLANILIKKYHPKLLIIGRLPGAEGMDSDKEKFLTDSAWVQYHLGQFSVNGWLLAKSHAYRYYQRLRTWIHRQKTSAKIALNDSRTNSLGFACRTDLLSKRSPEQIKKYESRLYSRFKKFRVSRRHLEALEHILQLRPEVEIVIVEMPVTPKFLSFFGPGKETRNHLIAEVKNRAALHGALFLETTHLNLIPDEGWADYNHLNDTGAGIFSRWMGKQIGEAVNQGLISSPLS